MKIKYNEDKQTFSIKGLNGVHLEILHKIMQNVRLGSDNIWREYAFELVDLFDRSVNHDAPDSGLVVFFTKEDGLGCIEVNDQSELSDSIIPGQFVEIDELPCDCSDCTC